MIAHERATVVSTRRPDNRGQSVSLDRVELMMDLEENQGARVDESATVTKLADLASRLPVAEETSFPTYNRIWIAKLIRGNSLEAIFLPMVKMFTRRRVFGVENLDSLPDPVIFAANHQSHFDTPIVLNSILYWLVALLFNGFPVPQTEAGAGESVRYMGELAEESWSILIFPEGERTTTAEVGRSFPGVGMIMVRDL